MTPDVNVLVAAARADHPHHAPARGWLETTFVDGASHAGCLLMPMVLASFLRIVTSPKIFRRPTPIDEAVDFVDALLALPGVRLAELGAEWSRFCRLCRDKALVSNDLPDAWLAAAVQQCGEHLVSFDRDFRRLLGRSQVTLLPLTSIG